MKNTQSNATRITLRTNKTLTAVAIASVIASAPVMAAEKNAVSAKTAAKSATIFTTATIVGGVAGGPVGFLLGALSGAYLGEQTKSHEQDKRALAETETSLSNAKTEVKMQNETIAKMQLQAAKPIEFLVYFPTGEDQLSHQDNQRVLSLANYMRDNPQLHVRLDGYADPRGTDEYNNVLSQERTKSVVAALTARGIDESRIEYRAHGAILSSAEQGDAEAYALERKVKIEVFTPYHQQEVAAF